MLFDVGQITREYAEKISNAFGRLVKDKVEIYEVLPEFALDTAETAGVEIPVEGNYLVVTEATDAATFIDVVLNDGNRDRKIRMRVGDELEAPLRKIRLTWTAQSGKDITLAVGKFLPGLFRFRRNAVQSIDTIATLSSVGGQDWISRLPTGFTKTYVSRTSGTADATLDYTLATVGAGNVAHIGWMSFSGSLTAAGIAYMDTTTSADVQNGLLAAHKGPAGQGFDIFGEPVRPLILTAGEKIKTHKEAATIEYQAGLIYYEGAA